jgi:2-haloacid dehalogenase
VSGIAIFDMNETTLDLGPVRTLVDELLSTGGGFTVWFQRLLQLSMATTATGQEFQDFGTLARIAFEANAEAGRIAPGPDAFATVATVLGSISPYPEVPAALRRLRDADWTLVALTNSGQAMVDGQVERAGLADLFDHVLSVEAVQTYKPSAAPYLHALEVIGAEPGDAWMVACHDWDLAGARAVGLQTAFIERRAMSYAKAYAPADLSVRDFTALADALLA